MKDYTLHLERSPITGKVELQRPTILTPDIMISFLFAGGAEAWKQLEPEEKESLTKFVRDEWLRAKDNSQGVAAAFFGNMLIRMHTDSTPVHGEYVDA